MILIKDCAEKRAKFYKNKRTKKLLEVKFGLGKFEITNLEIYKNPPVKFNGRSKFKGM